MEDRNRRAGRWPEVGGCDGLASLGFYFPGLLLAGARGCLGFWNAPFRIGDGLCRGWGDSVALPLRLVICGRWSGSEGGPKCSKWVRGRQ